MRKFHLFEIMDFKWFPDFLRRIITDTIKVSDKNSSFDRIVPIIVDVMQKSGSNKVVDLCSGAGGPWLRLFKLLKEQVPDFELQFTDLFPNKEAADSFSPDFKNKVAYNMTPVDATNVPKDLNGVRTFFGSFHHMTPDMALQILQDAADKKVGIVIGEINMMHRKKAFSIFFLQTILFPLYLLMFWVMALKAMKGNLLTILGRVLFTYIIPIIPLVMMWDSAVSAVRVYMKEDLEELIANVHTEGYVFKAEAFQKYRALPAIQYCIGYPVEK